MYPTSSSIFQRFGLKRIHLNPYPASVCGRRFYYLHRFKPSEPKKWFQISRTVLIVVLVESWVFINVDLGHWENVPCTTRKHFVLSLERYLGENEFVGNKFPASYSESVRVSLIAKEIIDASERGLNQGQDMGPTIELKRPVDYTLRELTGKEGQFDTKTGSKSQQKGSRALNWEVLVVNEPIVNAFCSPLGC